MAPSHYLNQYWPSVHRNYLKGRFSIQKAIKVEMAHMGFYLHVLCSTLESKTFLMNKINIVSGKTISIDQLQKKLLKPMKSLFCIKIFCKDEKRKEMALTSIKDIEWAENYYELLFNNNIFYLRFLQPKSLFKTWWGFKCEKACVKGWADDMKCPED